MGNNTKGKRKKKEKKEESPDDSDYAAKADDSSEDFVGADDSSVEENDWMEDADYGECGSEDEGDEAESDGSFEEYSGKNDILSGDYTEHCDEDGEVTGSGEGYSKDLDSRLGDSTSIFNAPDPWDEPWDDDENKKLED